MPRTLGFRALTAKQNIRVCRNSSISVSNDSLYDKAISCRFCDLLKGKRRSNIEIVIVSALVELW